MPNYLANYSFKHPDSALRPKDQLWGNGTVHINTDKVPVTAEEFKEIAKEVFRIGNGSYESVAITSLEPLDIFTDDTATVIEGTLINE